MVVIPVKLDTILRSPLRSRIAHRQRQIDRVCIVSHLFPLSVLLVFVILRLPAPAGRDPGRYLRRIDPLRDPGSLDGLAHGGVSLFDARVVVAFVCSSRCYYARSEPWLLAW